MDSSFLRQPLALPPSLKERVWGGHRLGDGRHPTGEAWLLHGDQVVEEGPAAGETLDALAGRFPRGLLGSAGSGGRFPLLIKLLDCQDWLSVQVHPDDTLARTMVGPGSSGKTEAWHVLEAAPGARLISGVREGVTAEELQAAILEGDVSGLIQEQEVQVGDTLFVPARTLHAIGPGLLIYEIQQPSDTTYRVYDWDRPASAGRELHLKQSAEVAQPGQASCQALQESSEQRLVDCPYFTLEQLTVSGDVIRDSTGGERPHALTVIRGEVRLITAGRSLDLRPFQTVLLPAALGDYALSGAGTVLRAAPAGDKEPTQPDQK